MYFQDDFWEAISTLPQRDRDACAGALLALYFDGEEDTKLRGMARGFYIAFRQRVLIAKARAIAGKKGGKRRGRKLKPEQVQKAIAGDTCDAVDIARDCADLQAMPQANAEAEPKQTAKQKPKQQAKQAIAQDAKQTGNQTSEQTASKPIKSEKEREKETGKEIKPVSLSEDGTTPNLYDAPDDAQNATFGLRCLKALNDVLGTTYGQLPPTCARFLASMEGRYTDEQVRRMIEYKREEWQGKAKMRKHLTASTLLSPDHFESYMQQSMQEGGADETFERFADAI